MVKEFPKKPKFDEIETKWQKYWEDKKIYKFDKNSKKEIYSIDTPPVYASAAHLHVGHALHYTQFEFMARFQRMNGKEVYFPPCFDNNGLPTEKYVEEKYKISKGDMPRAKFRKLCREESSKVEKDYGDRTFKKLALSQDWNLLYTTIDPQAQKVSQKAFLDLVKQKDAYRAKEPTLWCPYHQTALAQAEVESTSRKTVLNYINFTLQDGKKIEIATTRPELLPSCVGIFVNPKDKRYKKFIGKKAIVPLFNNEVEILTDEKVDPKFGSGMVMICTFGDSTDIEWWKKHKLPLKICMTKDGKLNELAGKYKGLSFKKAREAIKDDLTGQGFLIKEEPLEQEVGVCWRCKTPVEYLVTDQWFIKTLKYKKNIISQAKKINWHPNFYRKRLEDWTKNLGWDWCISRQRYYGVPIPAWYCKKCGEVLLADEKDLPIDPVNSKPSKKCKCGSTDFIADEDVFDTWMTSSMTPQIASKQLDNPKLYKKIMPMSLRPQSHDIIRTWAFYTILKSYLLEKNIPWKNVMIGTYVLDNKGKGMSKSLGNVVWLEEMLKKYPIDAIRYWAASAGVGEDLPFQEKEMSRGLKLLTKLWNASRFVSMHLDKTPKKADLEIADKWMLSKLSQTIKDYKRFFENYEISKARKEIEMFFLHDFCDFYLEMVKYRLYGDNQKSKDSAKFALKTALNLILKMWSPFIPHTTEEIYQILFAEEKSIHLAQIESDITSDKKALEKGELAVKIISEIRKYKQDNNMSLGKELDEYKVKTKEDISDIKELIKGAMRIKNLK